MGGREGKIGREGREGKVGREGRMEGAINSMVECFVYTEEAVGSTPTLPKRVLIVKTMTSSLVAYN